MIMAFGRRCELLEKVSRVSQLFPSHRSPDSKSNAYNIDNRLSAMMQSPKDDVDTHIAFLRSAIRLLEVAIDDVPTDAANEKHSGEDDSTKAIWFAFAAVGVILCYCYCLVSVVRQRLCGRQQDEVPALPAEGSIVVHDGMIFNLNPAQRRAVLEVIFSEASEVSVDMCCLLDLHMF